MNRCVFSIPSPNEGIFSRPRVSGEEVRCVLQFVGDVNAHSGTLYSKECAEFFAEEQRHPDERDP